MGEPLITDPQWAASFIFSPSLIASLSRSLQNLHISRVQQVMPLTASLWAECSVSISKMVSSFISKHRERPKSWHNHAGFKGKEAGGAASMSSVLPPPFANRNNPSWQLQIAQAPPHWLSSFLPSLGIRQISSSIKLYKTRFTSMISYYFVWIAELFISFERIVMWSHQIYF